MDQGAACHRRHRVDARHALSAASVRLSLRGGDWVEAVRDVQADGWVKDFATDRNTRSERFYRFINEVQTILMIGIVILVVVTRKRLLQQYLPKADNGTSHWYRHLTTFRFSALSPPAHDPILRAAILGGVDTYRIHKMMA